MSRVGNKPVTVPDGVTIELAARALTTKGKLGELTMAVVDQVEISHAGIASTAVSQAIDSL